MNQRQKEDKLMKSLSDPTENHSEEIDKLINDTSIRFICVQIGICGREKKKERVNVIDVSTSMKSLRT